ncbi:MAG: GntR family phosphonate transport system transcriptional regulator [Candidatus Endobugula sp.]|jgi:GntR family phosphonate transport system transcriptional regulator
MLSRQAIKAQKILPQPSGQEMGQPIYKQLAYAIEGMITKDFSVGHYLPSENDLALHFGVNRHTIRRAIDDLVAAGFVLRKQGKGCLVINQYIEYPLSAGRFTTTVDKLGHNTVTHIIKSEKIQCNRKVANYLGIKESLSVYMIQTSRWVDDQPMSLITHFLNPEYVPNIEQYFLKGSLHECIKRHYGIDLVRNSALISATMPTNEEALLLKSALTKPLLKVKSFNSMKNLTDNIVEVSVSISRSDRFQIRV